MKGREFEQYLAGRVGPDPETCRPESPPGITFDSPEQKMAIEKIIYARESVFLTGCAGSGKTTLVRYLQQWLINLYGKRAVKTTAVYGSAAANTNISGACTFHSFMGIGLGKKRGKDQYMTASEAKHTIKPEAVHAIKEAKVIILDELSVLSDEYFELCNGVTQKVRQQESVFFGGIQMIFIGDFKQLPSIDGKPVIFSSVWKNYMPKKSVVLLKKNYRQAGDMDFLHMINQLRDGIPIYKNYPFDKRGVRIFNRCMVPHQDRPGYSTDDVIVSIVSTRRQAYEINQTELDRLQTLTYTFEATTRGDPFVIDFFNKNLLTPQNLVLKVGARVLATANVDVEKGISNGAPAIVREIGSTSIKVYMTHTKRVEEIKRYRWTEITDEGKITASWTQFPLMLAWGITVEKSQGLTIDKIVVDFERMFIHAKDSRGAYVACSRTRDCAGLQIKNADRINWDLMHQDPKIQEWFDNLN